MQTFREEAKSCKQQTHSGKRLSKRMKFLVPRKYRSLLYKLLVIVPVIWLTVILIAHNNSGHSSPEEPLQNVAAAPHQQMPAVKRQLNEEDVPGFPAVPSAAVDNNHIDNDDADKKTQPQR